MKKLIIAALVLIVLAVVGVFVAVRVLLNPERVRAAVEAQVSSAVGLPVKVGSVNVNVWPRAGVSIAEMAVGEPAQVTLAKANLSTSLGALLSRRIEDAEVTIEDSTLDVVQLLGTLAGLATPAKGSASAPPDAPAVTIVNVRAIGLRNVELVVGDRRANVTLESSLRGDRLDVQRLSAKTAETTLEATGAVVSIMRRVARFKIKADPLDLDGLMQFAGAFSKLPDAPASPDSTAAPPPIDLEADVTAKRGRAAGLDFTNLQTTIAVTPNGVTLRPLNLTALNGKFEGAVNVALAGAEPALALNGAVAGVDLQQLAAFASGAPSSITGTLDAKFTLTGRGLDATSAIRTANGTADVNLAKGRLPGLHLVRPAILAFGKPQGAPPEGNGEEFDRIAATIAIARGQLRTENLLFASRDVDVDGAGTLTVAGGGLDVKADLKLSEELSAQAGRDLVRYTREGNRVVLPATVTGNVASPFVMIDTKQAVSRALKNEIQDRTNKALDRIIPGGLFKKPPKP